MSYWDKYKCTHEPDHHWELRKKFLEAHKDKFEEQRLICLAQVFYNVEFLGCKYPKDVMTLIENLSEGVVDEHREQQKTKLQRTFVGASEAAESKVCRTAIKRKSDNPEDDGEKSAPKKHSFYDEQSKGSSSVDSQRDLCMKNINNFQQQWDENLIRSFLDRNLPVSRFILIMMKDETELTPNSMSRSISFSKMKMNFETTKIKAGLYSLSMMIGFNGRFQTFVSLTTSNNITLKPALRASKNELLQLAYEKFKREHFIIIINNMIYSSQGKIKKDETNDSKNEETSEEQIQEENEVKKKSKYISDDYEKVAESNIGSKLLKLMGWSGSGGLGKNQQGISEPVPITGRLTTKRVGLADDEEKDIGLNVKKPVHLVGASFEKWAKDLLKEYRHSSKLLWFEDLIFPTDFTKTERGYIHSLCQKHYRTELISKSSGKGENRHLVISRKNTKNAVAILFDLLKAGDNAKFSLIIPEQFLS